MKGTNKQFLLLALSFGGATAIMPFAAMRFFNEEWLVGIVDTVMVLGMLSLGIYVYITKKIKLASILLVILALSGVALVIHLKGPSLLYWAYPTMIGTYFLLKPLLAAKLTSITILLIMLTLIQQVPLAEYVMVLITLTVNNYFSYVFTTQMINKSDELSLLVRCDSLTGIGNRRALDEKIAELIAFNLRTGQAASLIFLDIDHFKRVNDIYGHRTGDQVLIQLTELVNRRIRQTDNIYRFGGEEFVIVLVDAKLHAAQSIAEEIRGTIENATFLKDRTLTVSMGVAEYIPQESPSAWLERGDKALYQAKEDGRNRTRVAENPAEAIVPTVLVSTTKLHGIAAK